MKRLVRCLSLLAALAGCSRQPSFRDVESGEVPLEPGETAAMTAILDAAGIRSRDARLGSGVGRTSVEIEAGHVVGLTLAGPLRDASALRALPGLARLDLRYAGAAPLDGIACPELRSLQLDGKDTPSLQPLAACPSLERLDIAHGGSDLLATLPSLPSLQVLHLDWVEAGPDGLAVLARTPGLRELLLGGSSGRRLDTLPALDELERIVLTNVADLTDLPLPSLPKLRELDARNIGAVEIVSLPSLPALEKLAVTKSRLQRIELPSLPALRELDLSENRLETLDGLGAPPALARLSVARNERVHDLQPLAGSPLDWMDVTGTKVGVLPAPLEARRVTVMAHPRERERNIELQKLIREFEARETTWVRRLPSSGGTIRNSGGSCRTSSGLHRRTDVRCDWTLGSLTGTVRLAPVSGEPLESMKHGGPIGVRTRVSVERGTVRVYFREVWDMKALAATVAEYRDPDRPAFEIRLGRPEESESYRTGYRFAEARPSQDAEIGGTLHWIGGDAVFWVAAIDGDAEGVRVAVNP